ncbi:N-terminal domain of NEFA-interacting nuclear protein NIP30-domain-containing protein [Paraphysoderma sedebokerense]|nr:N-terminal domain of NEFA-interacting nuclear protein NIP30-domain-containing protein [Paraphysoderma sedebokerense]
MDGTFTLKSAFISENQLEEAKKKREEEYKKTHDGKAPPPEEEETIPFDPRPLAERLAEQKRLKEEAFREATKFGNLIHKLDNDEFEFLKQMEAIQSAKLKEQAVEISHEIEEFKKLQEETFAPSVVPNSTVVSGSNAAVKTKKPDFQKKLLSGVVVKKRKEMDDVKLKKDQTNTSSSSGSKTLNLDNQSTKKPRINGSGESVQMDHSQQSNQKAQVVSSLVAYNSSDDSDD